MDGQKRPEILEKIREAEMILVGFGEEFTVPVPESRDAGEAAPFLASGYYAGISDGEKIIRAYTRLRELIGAKPYFAVTLNTDDLIFRGGFEEDLVVAPCGSMSRMQCGEHIVPAEPVREKILRELEELPPQETHRAAQIVARHAKCPVCGKPLRFHVKSEEGYMESGYLSQWQSYNRWLSCTLNRKLCILELGVGFAYPQVIRWPFEKVTYFNQKSVLIRVHSRLPQMASELADRGISVPCDPIDFCLTI